MPAQEQALLRGTLHVFVAFDWGEEILLDQVARLTGLVVDWQEYDALYTEAGLIPPKDHVPATEEFMLYDADSQRVGYATSFMYSPMLQRHIAIARVRPDLATPGTRVDLEVTVNHRYRRVGARVARMPLYNPAHKTA
jgi:aminomethyltransferase